MPPEKISETAAREASRRKYFHNLVKVFKPAISNAKENPFLRGIMGLVEKALPDPKYAAPMTHADSVNVYMREAIVGASMGIVSAVAGVAITAVSVVSGVLGFAFSPLFPGLTAKVVNPSIKSANAGIGLITTGVLVGLDSILTTVKMPIGVTLRNLLDIPNYFNKPSTQPEKAPAPKKTVVTTKAQTPEKTVKAETKPLQKTSSKKDVVGETLANGKKSLTETVDASKTNERSKN
jgi:hypothetical protein